MNEQEALAKIERFARKQFQLNFPCPRCGERNMAPDPARNALSRRTRVYICDLCGIIEAVEDAVGQKTPLTSWDIARHENWPM